jgi:hypothetical protein
MRRTLRRKARIPISKPRGRCIRPPIGVLRDLQSAPAPPGADTFQQEFRGI